MVEKNISNNLITELFSDSTGEDKRYVLRDFEKGSLVSAVMEGNNTIGLVVNGCIEVAINGYDGSYFRISTIGAHEYFGLSNLFAKESEHIVLRSTKKTTVAYISLSYFLSKLKETPEMIEQYIQLCSKEFQLLTNKIALLSIPNVRKRLLSYFYSNVDHKNKVCGFENKEQLAGMLGISRASLFRELSLLSGLGMISVTHKNIYVLKPEQTEA